MTIFLLTLKSASRGIYLMSYSVILPLILFIGLGLYFDAPNYHLQLLAGIIGVSIIFWGMVTNAFTIYQQQLQGVYKLLHITPMSFMKFLISTISAWIVVSIVLTLILIVTGVIVFSLEINIMQIISMLLFVIVGTLLFSLTGFIIALMSQSINQVSMTANLIAFPLIVLSQAFYSLDSFPTWIQSISSINPFQYFVQGIGEILSKNYLDSMASLIILVGITIILLLVANFTYRKTIL